ncbi:hypothetical protein BU17DRAFT_65601 [Hysterangium stoloniferum]|nr:hypothetical protein BU17DRAFT_65601 [Hysterangium stoloniferum]
MATSRPRTPAAISDTLSDPGSLSDLESGWTDLSSNRSNGRRTPSTTSDIDDSEDATSLIDRFDNEAWEGLTSEADEAADPAMNDSILVVDPTPTPPVQLPSPQIPTVALAPEEEKVVDTLGPSHISESGSLSGSAQHISVRSSNASIRLSFPDPLSDSREELLPSHALSRNQRKAACLHSKADESIVARASSPEFSVQPPPTAPSDDHDVVDDIRSDGDPGGASLKPPVSSYTPTLVVVLVGYSPLPHLKDSVMSSVFSMVASVLDGSPVIPEEKNITRLYSVPVYSRASMKHASHLSKPMHRILVSDATTGSSMSSSFDTWDCPTLTLVFIQPPFATSSLPPLPPNTKYLPLLLPSISDEASSSLLDLSPSILFDHSVPNLSVPDHTPKRQFASHQCDNLHIGDKRLDGTGDVLNVDEFLALPPQQLSPALGDLIFKRESKQSPVNNRVGSVVTRKPIVFISAFLVALLFGFTVLTRDPLPIPPSPTTPTPTEPISNDQNSWPFLHPLVTNVPSPVPASISTSLESSETAVVRSRALSPASLKSLAVSVFRHEVKVSDDAAPGPSTKSSHESEKCTTPPSLAAQGRQQAHPPTLDAAMRPLTLDPPVTKSVSLLHPPSQSSVKGKEKAIDDSPETEILKALTSVSSRISHALAPLIDSMSHDLRELMEAIDILLRSVMQLQEVTSQRMNGLVQAVTRQASQVQEFASKVYSAAQTVGEQAAYRHDRAKDNARKVRDVGERYVSAAKEKFGASFERAKGNAKTILKEGITFGKHTVNSRKETRRLRREARETRRLTRKEVWYNRQHKKQGGSCRFYSVLGLV